MTRRPLSCQPIGLGSAVWGEGGRRYAVAGVHNNSLPFCHTYPTKEQGEGPPVFLLNSIGQLQKT